MASGKYKFHPTQKSLPLFEALIEKHSNPEDTVLDTFLGGGTTALACKHKNRKFKGCDINEDYIKKVNENLDKF
jgi:site-specific DNA-methyltransferase (adenine-specific)